MRLIATRRNSFESRLIQWGTDSDSSHFAGVFYESSVPIVMQSNFLGVDFQSAKMFFQKSVVVHEVKFDLTQAEEDEIFDSIVKTMVGEEYDWGAFAYFAKCGFMHKVFNCDWPTENKWARSDRALCVEMAKSFPDKIVPPRIKELDLSMIYPTELIRMIATEKWRP